MKITSSDPFYKRKLNQLKLMYLDWIFNQIHQLLLTKPSLVDEGILFYTFCFLIFLSLPSTLADLLSIIPFVLSAIRNGVPIGPKVLELWDKFYSLCYA